MNEDLYSDYIRREPHPKSAVLIRKWHQKLLDLATDDLEYHPKSVLEIGPGHGYFAEHCRNRGIDYEFCDTSPAVFEKMNRLGFKGHLGMLHEVSSALGKYDMIWMSHVLEHSPSWIDARQLVAEARDLLSPEGAVVVVSPDVLSWRREFWNVDWSHGYPTSIRNVSQLCSDVGLENVKARHHRNASSNIIVRAIFAGLTLAPHRILDRLLSPSRHRLGDGFVYSWKAVFGWRQILVKGFQRPQSKD